MTTFNEGVWTPIFPRRTSWSTITYSKVPRLGVTSLCPANDPDDKLVVIRPHRGSELLRIPPGDSPWETRVRIIGPEAETLQETTELCTDQSFGSGSAMDDGMSTQATVKIGGDILSRSYSDADTRSTPVYGVRESPVYTIKGTDVDKMVIRTDETTTLIPASRHTFSAHGPNVTVRIIETVPNTSTQTEITDPPRKIRIRPARPDDPKEAIEYATSVPVSRIIIRNGPTQKAGPEENATTTERSSGTTHVWLPITQCAVRNLPDLLKDLAVLCTIKRRNVSDIQLHVSCHRFRTIRQLYDNLCKISNLKLNLSTQTLTRTTRRRSDIRPEGVQYEICVRSDNNTSLLEAARVCREASETVAAKCTFRISTNTHTYN